MDKYGQLHGSSLLPGKVQDKHHSHPTSYHGHYIDITDTEIKSYKYGVVSIAMMSLISNIIVTHLVVLLHTSLSLYNISKGNQCQISALYDSFFH